MTRRVSGAAAAGDAVSNACPQGPGSGCLLTLFAHTQDHYKLALGQVNMARNLIDKIARGASPFSPSVCARRPLCACLPPRPPADILGALRPL